MLTIWGRGDRGMGRDRLKGRGSSAGRGKLPGISAGGFCDGRSRRSFLQVGSMALGGLSLPQLLHAESMAGERAKRHRGVINIFLPGGPPHQDMWDMKPDAPEEIRGPLRPIATSVAGIEICELFPKLAQRMQYCVPIRSIVGAKGPHYSDQCLTGHDPQSEPAGGWPSFGAWVSQLAGNVDPGVPAHLSLFYKTDHMPWGDPGDGGFLGLSHAPLRLMGGKEGGSKLESLVLQDISLERLHDRARLLKTLDNFRRDADRSGAMAGYDAYTEQAIGILSDSKLARALDLSTEDPAIVARYGTGDGGFVDDGAPRMPQNLLIARRLIEAGARVVSLNFSRWDWHDKAFEHARREMPVLDQALAALIEDLVERDMHRDVAVVVWGEFGRTPKINAQGGRDHWPQVSTAMLCCGDFRTGQVIGATDRLGEQVVSRPVAFQEVLATLYHHMGLDVATVRQFDLRGRPYYPLESGTAAIRELI
jgi:hypothetical protein